MAFVGAAPWGARHLAAAAAAGTAARRGDPRVWAGRQHRRVTATARLPGAAAARMPADGGRVCNGNGGGGDSGDSGDSSGDSIGGGGDGGSTPQSRRGRSPPAPGPLTDAARIALYTISSHGDAPRAATLAARSVDTYDTWAAARPVAAHTAAAFETAASWLAAPARAGRPLVLDSGCGTGTSTRALAAGRHADAVVIGVDRSHVRLSRNALYRGWLGGVRGSGGGSGGGEEEDEWKGEREREGQGEPDREEDEEAGGARLLTDALGADDGGNVLLLRADVVDLWRLAADAGWAPTHHYLLYPNPYPSSGDVNKRWGSHPVLPALLRLGGVLILRASWRPYLTEFAAACTALNTRLEAALEEDAAAAAASAAAMEAAAMPLQPAVGPALDIGAGVRPWVVPPGGALTAFEAKYNAVGLDLWALTVSVDRARVAAGLPAVARAAAAQAATAQSAEVA
ncbi:hypothetical protein MMPV_002490 [Pyropia vietnamensis]